MAAAGFQIPSIPWQPLATGFTTLALDASTDKTGWIFAMPEDATINTLCFRYGARTGTPPTYDISIQGVNASGMPDGVKAVSATFTPPADATWNSTLRAISVSNTALNGGQLYAMVIEYSSGTVNASNLSSFTQYTQPQSNVWLPYSVQDTTGSWAMAAASQVALFGLRSSSKSYGNPVIAYTIYSTTNAGDRVTLKFTPPAGWCDTLQVKGIRFTGLTAASGSVVAGIWNAAGTALGSATYDSDASFSTAARGAMEYFFDPITLTAGTTYYAGLEQVSTQTTSLRTYTLGDSADLTAYGWGSAGGNLATWNGSAWTDTLTEVAPVALILADITEPTGGSGGGPLFNGRLIQ